MSAVLNEPVVQGDIVLDAIRAIKWDGRNRLDHWMHECLGAADTTYNRLVARHFMLGMVARRLYVGCSFDAIPILIGEQGCGKSTLLAQLVRPYGSHAQLPGLETAQVVAAIKNAWLIELSELDSINRSEAAQLKSWITARQDAYRPAYSTSIKHLPRSFMVVGTSSGGEFEGRRFWPIQIRRLNIERLDALRDQLMAEALHWLVVDGEGRQNPNRAELEILARRGG